jgi:hypothetical protein
VRPPRELNPRVSVELEAVILRLLSIAPVERFGGKAREVAEALEQAAEGKGSEGDEPLFVWSQEQGPRLRSSATARRSAERDAAARDEHAQREEQERRRARMGRPRALPRSLTPRWRAVVATGFLGVLLAGLTVAVRLRGLEWIESFLDSRAREGGRVAVGDSASSVQAGSTALSSGDKKRGVTASLPEQPFPGQSKPPCKRAGDVELRGGCWHRLADLKPPCKEEGKEDAYAWKGACYTPSLPLDREPTSSPP